MRIDYSKYRVGKQTSDVEKEHLLDDFKRLCGELLIQNRSNSKGDIVSRTYLNELENLRGELVKELVKIDFENRDLPTLLNCLEAISIIQKVHKDLLFELIENGSLYKLFKSIYESCKLGALEEKKLFQINLERIKSSLAHKNFVTLNEGGVIEKVLSFVDELRAGAVKK